MKSFLSILLISFFTLYFATAQSLEYYELRTYHCASQDQLERVDRYLEEVFVPMISDYGITQIGVFRDLVNDTARHKKIFVLLPAKKLSELEQISDWMMTDVENADEGTDYLHASHGNPAYERIEINWLRAFANMPQMAQPNLTGNISDRIFELRSYEGAAEHLYRRKVDMFNAGGEIALFKALNFNAVFYAEVLTGSHMPNLMYMTSFDNMASRNEHWDAFRNSPIWKELKAIEKYKNTVSKADIYLLQPAHYSKIN